MSKFILKEYIRNVLVEGGLRPPDTSSLGALVSSVGEEKEIVLFRHDYIYSALSKLKGGEDLFNFLKDTIYDSVVGYAVISPPDKGEAYGAYEMTHIAGPGYAKVLFVIGHSLSPSGILVIDRERVSPDAAGSWGSAWSRKEKSGKALKLDALPPNNKTKDPNDDAVLHNKKGLEPLDYAYEPEGWEGSVASKVLSRGEASLKDLSDDVNRDAKVLKHVFMSGGKNFFRNQYESMLKRTRG